MRSTSSQKNKQVKGLGSIPLLGNLFRNIQKTNVSTETVVLITPRIINPGTDPYTQDTRLKVDEQKRQFEKVQQKIDESFSEHSAIKFANPLAPQIAAEPPAEVSPSLSSEAPVLESYRNAFTDLTIGHDIEVEPGRHPADTAGDPAVADRHTPPPDLEEFKLAFYGSADDSRETLAFNWCS